MRVPRLTFFRPTTSIQSQESKRNDVLRILDSTRFSLGVDTIDTFLNDPPPVLLKDLAVLPGNRFEALAGDRRGQYSIRVNDQWRICFEWPQGAPGPFERGNR